MVFFLGEGFGSLTLTGFADSWRSDYTFVHFIQVAWPFSIFVIKLFFIRFSEKTCSSWKIREINSLCGRIRRIGELKRLRLQVRGPQLPAQFCLDILAAVLRLDFLQVGVKQVTRHP